MCTRQEFLEKVEQAHSVKELLQSFGMRAAGGNYQTMWARMAHEKVDVQAFREKTEKAKPRVSPSPLASVMVRNSTFSRSRLKARIRREGIIPYQCGSCGLGDVWEGAELVLVLDHINGVHNDHRKENLRFLCPNCNSQTPTFAGRNSRKPSRTCETCETVVRRESRYCRSCAGKKRYRETRQQRPPKTELEALVKEHGYRATGRMFDVSDTTIRKWLR